MTEEKLKRLADELGKILKSHNGEENNYEWSISYSSNSKGIGLWWLGIFEIFNCGGNREIKTLHDENLEELLKKSIEYARHKRWSVTKTHKIHNL